MKRKLSLFIIAISALYYSSIAQKLVVGIVVDQMRFDQLYKYQSKYSDGGFKRLMNEGYNFKNMHYNYVPTVTASGHASIYTGATPSVHGIINNDWFDRRMDQQVGNVEDSLTNLIGVAATNVKAGSPQNLLSTTIGDQLKLASQFKSKVISISLKDRGAILPTGHTADAAYWHDWQNSSGNFVTSSYYLKNIAIMGAGFQRFKEI